MNIIAVTACPTGIAHTYMAAAAIKKAAEGLGHMIKVETQGAIGIENKLAAKDVAAADLVIIAADVAIKDEERFNGKCVYRAESQRAIKNPQGILVDGIAQLKLQSEC
ncbi:PTS fructose transporter subunit IIB [Azotosporobacter soli]|uniref:PTS fructose transporter subunit IIB n=1 Tax=Azotosporobacter soli TaxID=3055040 RepID=UPI0031FF2B20